jgi:hypothetical protein
MDKPSVPIHHACPYLSATICEIENLERYYDTKVLGQGSRISKTNAVHFGSASAARDAVSDTDSVETALIPHTALSSRWVPPISANVKTDEYHSQVLREDGYL